MTERYSNIKRALEALAAMNLPAEAQVQLGIIEQQWLDVQGFYPILYLERQEVLNVFEITSPSEEDLQMIDAVLPTIAEKVGDNYYENQYRDDLEIIAKLELGAERTISLDEFADEFGGFLMNEDGEYIEIEDNNCYHQLCLWTEMDDGSYISGIHYINRVRYLATEKPVSHFETVIVQPDYQEE